MGASGGIPPALLVLLPGGLLYPRDSAGLLDALQKEQQRGSAVALWVAAAAVDWSQLPRDDPGAFQAAGDAAVASAVEAAVARGFAVDRPSPSSLRAENVFVAAHSLSEVFVPGYPMRNAAGVVSSHRHDGLYRSPAVSSDSPSANRVLREGTVKALL